MRILLLLFGAGVIVVAITVVIGVSTHYREREFEVAKQSAAAVLDAYARLVLDFNSSSGRLPSGPSELSENAVEVPENAAQIGYRVISDADKRFVLKRVVGPKGVVEMTYVISKTGLLCQATNIVVRKP